MSNLEFVGRMNPQPFLSLAKEEKMRIEGIKQKMMNEKSGSKVNVEPELEIVYERDIQEDY